MERTAEAVTAGLDLTGRRYLVTGATSGIGRETARVLAKAGATVIACGRTTDSAAAAAADIPGSVEPLGFDLEDIDQVRAAAASVDGPLDGVLANAGVMAPPELRLIHGVEWQLLVNHVAHAALVMGLTDQLADDGRVVIVASAAHSMAGRPDFSNLGHTGKYRPWIAYGRSKLANILFARELATRLPSGQTANALHPGMVDTGLSRHLPAMSRRALVLLPQVGVDRGAAMQTYLATSPEVSGQTGGYWAAGKLARGSSAARDRELAAELWSATEGLLDRI